MKRAQTSARTTSPMVSSAAFGATPGTVAKDAHPHDSIPKSGSGQTGTIAHADVATANKRKEFLQNFKNSSFQGISQNNPSDNLDAPVANYPDAAGVAMPKFGQGLLVGVNLRTLRPLTTRSVTTWMWQGVTFLRMSIASDTMTRSMTLGTSRRSLPSDLFKTMVSAATNRRSKCTDGR